MEEGRANVKADGILEQWWVMRVAYQQELKAKAYCDNANVTSFIPMRYATTEAKGRRKRRLVPAIHNLIFIRESEEKMKDLKPCMEAKKIPVRYWMDHTTGKQMTVPDREMQNFIKVSDSYDDGLIFMDAANCTIPDLKDKDRVRVTEGPFRGVEGVVVTIRKDRRVLVEVRGSFAVATSFIHPSLLEKI
jgi:transcription antitermination factor NusG